MSLRTLAILKEVFAVLQKAFVHYYKSNHKDVKKKTKKNSRERFL